MGKVDGEDGEVGHRQTHAFLVTMRFLPGTSDGMDDYRGGDRGGRRKLVEHYFHLNVRGDVNDIGY